MTLRRALDEAFVGFLPWALLHAPEEARTFSADAVWRSLSGATMADVVIACLNTWACGAGVREPATRLRALGSYLRELGSLPWPEFQDVVPQALWRRQAAYLVRLEGELAAHGEPPLGFDTNHTAGTREDCRMSLSTRGERDFDPPQREAPCRLR